jgi:NADPH-dependent curcumin reductase CurA
MHRPSSVPVANDFKLVTEAVPEIAQHAPNGVNVIFENVGGDILDAGLNNLAMYAHIGVGGLISGTNDGKMILKI